MSRPGCCARKHLPLARVAERVGYQSEAAFNRAFRRAHGVTPGAFARRGPAFLDLVHSAPRSSR